MLDSNHMAIGRLRRSFVSRRWVHRLLLDMPDSLVRAFTGRSHWPPYSLRSFVGGGDFDAVGRWFVEEFRGLGLLRPGERILDIGCGCGRIAYALALEKTVREQEIHYDGMDIDQNNIRWCQRHITRRNANFRFFHADCYSPSYNPRGRTNPKNYRFPFTDSTFHLVLLTSVFTHMLEEELSHYLSEVARLLTPDGTAYATFFLCRTLDEARNGLERHKGLTFGHVLQNAAVSRPEYPTDAVAYPEAFVRQLASRHGLEVVEPARYGVQDVLLFRKQPG